MPRFTPTELFELCLYPLSRLVVVGQDIKILKSLIGGFFVYALT